MFFSVLSCFSCVWLFVTPWAIAAHQTPLSMKFSQARILEWIAISFSRESYSPRNQTWVSCVSCIVRQVLYHSYHLGSPFFSTVWCSFIHGALGRVWGWWVSLFSKSLNLAACFFLSFHYQDPRGQFSLLHSFSLPEVSALLRQPSVVLPTC